MHKKCRYVIILSVFLIFSAGSLSSSEDVTSDIEAISANMLKMLTDELSFRSREVKPGQVEKLQPSSGKHKMPTSFDFYGVRDAIIKQMKNNEDDYFNTNEKSSSTLKVVYIPDITATTIRAELINENEYLNGSQEPRNEKKKYWETCEGKYCVLCREYSCRVTYRYGRRDIDLELEQEQELKSTKESDGRPYYQILVRSNVYQGYDSISLKGNEPRLWAVDRPGNSTPFHTNVPAGNIKLVGKAEYGFYDITMNIVVSSESDRTIDLDFIRVKPGERKAEVVNDCFEGCPELIFIPTSKFTMGGYKDNEKPHRELKPEPFLISRYEITVGEFRKFVDGTGYETDAERKGYCKVQGGIVANSASDSTTTQLISSFFKSLLKGDSDNEIKGNRIKGGRRFFEKSNSYWDKPGFDQTDEHPVVCVSWNDAQAYLKWLSNENYRNYRLPTEVEWEYAARATSSAKYSWGDSLPECDTNVKNGANFDDDKQCGDSGTVKVGSYQESRLGLYDMHGNVHEWVQDCSQTNEHYGDPTTVAVEPKDCHQRIVRGGSWNSPADNLRSAFRGLYNQDTPASNAGFRVVRDAFTTSSDQR